MAQTTTPYAETDKRPPVQQKFQFAVGNSDRPFPQVMRNCQQRPALYAHTNVHDEAALPEKRTS
jgi:hypothetical protein